MVYATLKNVGSSSVAPTDSLYIKAIWNGEEYYGVRFPEKHSSWLSSLWALSDESIRSGESLEMVYLISLPKNAKSEGTLSLLFDDDTECVIR